MRVYFDSLTTQPGHSHRGIGMYARMLLKELKILEQDGEVSLVDDPSAADIIHIPTFDLFAPTFPFKYLFTHKKIILTIHDVIPLLFPDKYLVGIRGKVAFFLQKNALKFVSHIITDSIASQNDIHTYLGVPLNKITPIYLAAGISEPKTSDTQAKKLVAEYKLPEKYILYVGDINYNKNVPSLLESIEYLPKDISLICIGRNFKPQPIPEWTVIEHALKNISDTKRVRFITDLGVDATKEIAAMYQLAFAYVQPSYYEGFGLPVLEAMQYGTPAVVAQNSSLIEVGGKCAVSVQPTAESIAHGVKQLADLSAESYKKIGDQSQQWAAQFSWKKTAQETVKVYSKLKSPKTAQHTS